ncbi:MULTISPECIES: hypothetical protein [Rhodomicrobium]|uniref:hypothetical protein n=1 Tax=Rhodomicrobium TaxID=1068 RepID=UPI000B4A754C|nr:MULTISPECIES: hypothetical protein [Rhodomicrobium]
MPHLSGKLRKTLDELFGHPEPANLEWREVFALVRHYGEVEELKNGHIVFSIGDRQLKFLLPREQTLDKDEVVKVRKFFRAAGITPDHPEPAPAPPPEPLPGVVLTIDHHEAALWRQEHPGGPLARVKRFHPHDPQHHRDNLRLKHSDDYRGQRAPEDPGYYKSIIKALQDEPEVLVVGDAKGSSSAMSVLRAFIERHQPSLLGRITAFVDTELRALTEAALREIAERHLKAASLSKN